MIVFFGAQLFRARACLFVFAALLASFFVGAPTMRAQCTYTQVTGTITDPNNIPYRFGDISVDLVSPGGGNPLCNGRDFPGHQGPTPLDSSGSFALTMPANTAITPGGTQWTFTVHSGATETWEPCSLGPVGFTLNVTVTGSSQSVSSALSAASKAQNLCGGSGSSGCAITGIPNLSVLSVHPLGTCYGSVHYTWDDGTGAQNLQAGLSNTLSADAASNKALQFVLGTSESTFGSVVFALGDNNVNGSNTNTVTESYMVGNDSQSCSISGATCLQIFSFGEQNYNESTSPFPLGTTGLGTDQVTGNFVIGEESAVGNATTSMAYGFQESIIGTANLPSNSFGNYFYAYLFGDNETLYATDSGTIAKDVHSNGWGNSYRAQTGALLQGVSINGSSNTFTSSSAGEVDEIYLVGEKNNVTSTGTNSTSDGLFMLGDENTYSSSAGAENAFNYVLGRSNTVTSSTASMSVNFSSVVGHTNTVTSTAAAVSDAVLLGRLNTATDCTDCLAFGENIHFVSANSNEIGLGMSNVPELQIVANNVRRNPQAFASLPTCAAGTEGSFAAVNNSTTATAGATITGGGTHHVLGYCNGTNWQVAVGI